MTELLSPAGSFDSFVAALSGGADAVYAGCRQFSARANAKNFTTEEFIEAIDASHLTGRCLYLTLNTLLKEEEMAGIDALLEPLYRAGLDGIIVQDLGAAEFIREKYPLLPLHASTQLAVTSRYGAAYLFRHGFSRVVPARELSLKELKEIGKSTGIEIEVFIHGAMCYSYSGMCLMSSFMGGRSGNRGRCAGCCRQSFGEPPAYYLSMKDLCALSLLPELVSAGVSSMKIEGRMKSPDYVYNVTKMYRKYLDILKKEGARAYRVEEADFKELSGIYLRGSVNEGYYKRHNDPDMITFERGSYRSEKNLPSAIPPAPSQKIEGVFIARAGERMRFCVKTEDKKKSFEAIGAEASKARERPLTAKDVKKQLNRTGGTWFSFSGFNIVLDGDVFIPVSALNSLRREALAGLREEILSDFRRTL